MPLSRVYKRGAIVYFAGDAANDVFVLQAGQILLSSISPEGKGEIRENIKSGEFFGVKSALGRFPREATAQVLVDATVMVLKTAEFEALAMKNHKLVMKMLRVFSNQLRIIGKTVKTFLDSSSVIDADESEESGLFNIAEYYIKNKRYNQAIYAYNKYIEYYPNGKFVTKAHQKLQMANNGNETGFAVGDNGSNMFTVDSNESLDELKSDAIPAKDDFSIDDSASTDFGMDDLDSDDMDYFFGSDSEDSGLSDESSEEYYEGYSLFSQGKYSEAIKIYRKVLSSGDMGEFAEKAQYDIARALLKSNQPDNAIEELKEFLVSYADSKLMKDVYYLLGSSYLITKQNDKGIKFLKKVLTMPPNDTISKKTQALMNKIGAS